MPFNPRNVRFSIKKLDNDFGIVISYKGTDFEQITYRGDLPIVKNKFMYILNNKKSLYHWVQKQIA